MSRRLSNFSSIVSSIKTEREGPPAAQHTQLSSTPSGPAGANVCQAQDLFPLKPKCREFPSAGTQASLSLQPQSTPLLDNPSSGALPTHRGLRQTGILPERDSYTDIMSVLYYPGIHQAPTMCKTVTAEQSRNCQDLEVPGNQRLSIHTQSSVTLSKLLSLSDPLFPHLQMDYMRISC